MNALATALGEILVVHGYELEGVGNVDLQYPMLYIEDCDVEPDNEMWQIDFEIDLANLTMSVVRTAVDALGQQTLSTHQISLSARCERKEVSVIGRFVRWLRRGT